MLSLRIKFKQQKKCTIHRFLIKQKIGIRCDKKNNLIDKKQTYFFPKKITKTYCFSQNKTTNLKCKFKKINVILVHCFSKENQTLM
jgi:hypothetical protein